MYRADYGTMRFRSILAAPFLALIGILCFEVFEACLGADAPRSPLFIRVSLLAPQARPWRVHVIFQRPNGKPRDWFAGKSVGDTAAGAEPASAEQASAWIDATEAATAAGGTVRFLFEVPGAPAEEGVKARIDVATAPDEGAILRSITEHDPGRIISIRVPGDPVKDRAGLLSIREDTQRRLDEIKAFNLPDGPLPRKLWCLTGFRSNGEFYTDPAIAQMDMEIIHRLGMNGFWEQNGGQPKALRAMAHGAGLDRSTVYWRSVQSPPGDRLPDGAMRLNWAALDQNLDDVYRRDIAATRAAHPQGMPEVIADLMDEPDGLPFAGPEYAEEFRRYLQLQGLTAGDFGKAVWAEVEPLTLRWRQFFARRAELELKDEPARRLFYWSAKFWNHVTARAYALATEKVEKYAPGTGTRVNFGPPWVYDYGTLPRGIDAFEFGRLRGVTLGFNEDWVGAGSPRVPLEMNTLLMDWSRAAARPATPRLGSYITRDADRATVKLRAFACLAREAKIFDFYYYGPAYTFFDHWSDNLPMVRGVAELTRDLAAAEDVLWEGRAPRAKAALLYSQSWPVWKDDDTELCEQMMAYLALLHAGVPVDIVSDTEVADGRFAARGYKCLYVVNESIPQRAAAEIERWVRAGGKLWASGWAGMRDEYDTPVESWNAMLGLKSRAWKPSGDLKRLGQPIAPADWLRPIFGREVTLQFADDAAAEPLGAIAHTGHEAQTYRRSHGKGRVQVVPWTAGKDYMDGAVTQPGALAKATIYPDDARRRVYTDFALESGVQPPATTSVSQILAWPLWIQDKGVILLANYTGAPAAEVRVRFETP